MPEMLQILRERATGMLTAGMSTRAAHVHFSTISVSKGVSENLAVHPTSLANRRPCNHTSPGPPHPASSPPRSSETSHPDSCCNNHQEFMHNLSQRSSSACSSSSSGSRPDCSSSCNRLEWANAHIRWRLALWRGVSLHG